MAGWVDSNAEKVTEFVGYEERQAAQPGGISVGIWNPSAR